MIARILFLAATLVAAPAVATTALLQESDDEEGSMGDEGSETPDQKDEPGPSRDDGDPAPPPSEGADEGTETPPSVDDEEVGESGMEIPPEDAANGEPEGETQPSPSAEVTKEEMPPLPPEPPADGIAGAWYLIDVTCFECATMVDQELVLDSPIEVIRGFNDQFVVNPDKVSGTFSEPSAARTTPLKVVEIGTDSFAFMTYNSGEGPRVTDVAARVWQFDMTAGEKMLYGRYYQVVALTDVLWTSDDAGWSTNASELSPGQLAGLARLDMVKKLDKDNNFFQFSDDARIEFARPLAAIRSDFDRSMFDEAKTLLKAALEAEAAREVEIRDQLTAAQEAVADEEWATCVTALSRVHELGESTDDTWYHLGKCNERLGDYEAAAPAYEKVLELLPSDVITLFRLAHVYESIGRLRDSMGLYDRIKKSASEGSRDWNDAHLKRLELLEKIYSDDN
jgi:hypothetical protein